MSFIANKHQNRLILKQKIETFSVSAGGVKNYNSKL
jgi:hypothetical protein